MSKVQVTTFYKFFPMDKAQLESFNSSLETLGQVNRIYGLFITGSEGVNTTFAGEPADVEAFKLAIEQLINLGPIKNFKDSFTTNLPFKDFKVKVREEIVTLGRTDIIPDAASRNNHLSPSAWHQMLQEDGVIVVDTRNDYEVEMGKFKNAIDPKIKEFTDFPKWVSEQNFPKDQKMMIYCTGGIRCEKAIYEMEEQGFNQVYQLDGGILNYLKERPNDDFEGECFVFDYRVSVDQELAPSKQFRLCPHCGQPGKEVIDCSHCGQPEIVCKPCLEKAEYLRTCSKNCAHHKKNGHQFRKIHKESLNKRHSF